MRALSVSVAVKPDLGVMPKPWFGYDSASQTVVVDLRACIWPCITDGLCAEYGTVVPDRWPQYSGRYGSMKIIRSHESSTRSRSPWSSVNVVHQACRPQCLPSTWGEGSACDCERSVDHVDNTKALFTLGRFSGRRPHTDSDKKSTDCVGWVGLAVHTQWWAISLAL